MHIFREMDGGKIVISWGTNYHGVNFFMGDKLLGMGDKLSLEGWRGVGRASGSVSFQYIGVGREQFYQYIVSIWVYGGGAQSRCT